MALNPGIIMSGQLANPVNAMAQGAAAGQQINDNRYTNAMRDMFKQNGAGILAGDQNAMNAMAQFDPSAAQGIQSGRINQQSAQLGMQATREQMAQRRASEARQVTQAAANATAAERAEIAQRIESAVAAGLQIQTPEEWDAFMAERNPDMVGQFDQRGVFAAEYMSVADSVKRMDARNGGGDVSVGAQDILEDGTVIQSTSNGVRVYSPTGEVVTGQAAADAVAAANAARVANERAVYEGRRLGTLSGDIDLGGQAAAAVDLGEATMSAGVDAWASVGRLNSNISNMQTAIDAIDDGAKSGIVYNMLPSVTQASASLENAMNNMGLDVVGSVTFGALSAGELKLAMNTAVPQNLGPTELRAWLVEKQAAQQKAVAMMADAAEFLTNPENTINDWINRNKERSGAGDGAGTPTRLVFDPTTGGFN